MKKLLMIILLALSTGANANLNYWKQVASVPGNLVQSIAPSRYTVFNLQETTLKNILFNLQPGYILQLPAPDGNMMSFRVEERSCMEQALASKYPEIKTFSGVAVNDRSITAKFEYTYTGFHAMIFNGTGTYIIDPYSNPAQGYYVCFYKRDLKVNEDASAFCLSGSTEEGLTKDRPVNILLKDVPTPQFKMHGANRRTYLLAMACTGEYSVKVAGTATPSKALSLSAITTTVNRINGVYEREVGVTMVLIGSNDDVIYLDGATDPYSNSNADMGTNQTNLDAVIGFSGYDIGHVLVTTGNAQAQLASVCDVTQKGQGVSGQPNPVGASFDIDFVAHEMGHQFGAMHTFNANTGSCFGNGASATAHEPGSGTTIMAYAGICAENNIQPHSDAYFHGKSLNQIADFLTVNGATCGTSTASNNTPPVVPSIQQLYHIPYLTPFELIAPEAVDTDHDTLTYCWEQWDLGSFGVSFANTTGTGPIFRSFNPSFSRTRVFPTLDKLRANQTNYLGEKLPEVTRSLEFKLTVRDIFNGYGTFNVHDELVTINATATSGPFKVLFPNIYADYWQSGGTATVTWDVANSTAAPVSCNNVDIFLSLDDGITYSYTLATNTPNDGNETISVPANIYSGGCRVKVKGAGNVFFDISNEGFRIFPWASSVSNALKNDGISVYPVPVKNTLFVDVNNNVHYKASVTNTLGQHVWSGSVVGKTTISSASWSAGVYSLQLMSTATNEIIIKKFVVE